MSDKRRVANVILRDQEGRILLQHRTDDAEFFPGMWGNFGGHMNPGETPEQAATRELKEELDVEPHEITFIKKFEFPEDGHVLEQYVFTAPLEYTVDQLRKQQIEGKDLGLFDREGIKKLNIIDSDREIAQYLFGKGRLKLPAHS